MTPAVTSLAALAVAIVLSCTSRINVGVLAVAFAWVIGVYHGGMKPEAVIAGFPVTLFVMLAGVTLLFAMAEGNGTLARVTQRVVRITGGDRRVLPIVFFGLACLISAVGPGAISAVALLAPLAMPLGVQAGVPRFLTALMVANGANAGNLSPVSAVGVIANAKMTDAGLGGNEMIVFAANFGAHLIVGSFAYLLFRGKNGEQRDVGGRAGKGFNNGEQRDVGGHGGTGAGTASADQDTTLERGHLLTLAVIAFWILAVVFLKVNVGLGAFGAAALLAALRAADETAAIKRMPWDVIVMVCGITVLIGVLEKSGGMDLFASALAALATPESINGSIAFITGLISTWSSTSGVVLPAFLPTVPALVANVGGGDPLAVALSINVGSALVDVSPLSTLGALCIATVSDEAESRRLFRQLMIWSLSMAVVGAVLAQLFAGVLARG
ncbi:MAG: SLC13 family permease [Gemmatimonadota bacterium]|nr:SLC13 family permease [Gemmatimonadota bacterium]